MKKLLLLLSCFLLLGAARAQQSQLKIKVVDEQNLSLPGAIATLDDGTQYGVSDRAGIIFIGNIQPGAHQLSVTYIGYEPRNEQVTCSGGITEMNIVLQSGVQLLDGVLVLGDRLKGQAKALNQQKNSDNITNIVSADQIGRFPDGNIGDAVKRVPGVTMQNDQGEARNIVVRGMGPEFNSVSLNGERVPSAEGDNRRVQMDLIPSDMIQTIEVNKTLTADMDADAIGGSVNLITRAAPNGLRISGTVAGGYNPIRQGLIGSGNLVLGQRFIKQKLGILLNGSYHNNDYGSDNIESVWLRDANGKAFIGDHDIRSYYVQRIRRSLGGTLDLQLSPAHVIYLSGNYNWRDDRENRFRLRHRYRGDEEEYADDLIYDAAGNITGYNNGEVLRQTKGGKSGGRGDGRRLEDQRVRILSLRGDHHFNALKLNWNIQYAKASEERPNERYIAMGKRDIQISQDIGDPELPLLSDQTPLDQYDRLGELTEQFQDQFEEDLNGKLQLELPLDLWKAHKTLLMLGGRYRGKKKERNNSFFSYEPINANEANYANISLLPLRNETREDFYPGSKFKAGDFITPDFLGGLNLKDGENFEESDEPSEYLAGNYSAKEQITAGYFAIVQELSKKLSANIGIRIEHTAIDYTGNIVVDEEELEGTATFENDYVDALPNVNLRFEATENTVIKAAWTYSLARPKYYDLVPYFNVNPNDLELSSGNPSLEPVRSMNLDLMAENYFKSIGLVSGGIFYKKIDHFFYNYLDQNYTNADFAEDFPGVASPIAEGDRWSFSQRRNGGGADLFGFEVALQRQLDFLPGFWKGFGVYANYTFTHSNAEGIYDGDGDLIRQDVKLPGAAPHMFNLSLSYENAKWVFRVSGNYTSSYVDDGDDAGYNADAFFDRYYDKQFFLDANASYAITPQWRVFAEANNLSNQPLRYYQGSSERTAQLEYYGPRLSLGVKFDFVK